MPIYSKGVTFRNLNLSPFCAIFSNNGGKLNFQNAMSLSLSRQAYLQKKITLDILRILRNGVLCIFANFQLNNKIALKLKKKKKMNEGERF